MQNQSLKLFQDYLNSLKIIFKKLSNKINKCFQVALSFGVTKLKKKDKNKFNKLLIIKIILNHLKK